MVSQATQDFVFSVVDASQEYNTKLVVFFVLYFMFIFMVWYSFKILPDASKPFDYHLSTVLVAMTMRLVPIIFIITFPLWLLVFTYRTIALEVAMRYIFYGYTVSFILLGIYGFIFGFEKLLDIFKMKMLSSKNMRNVRRSARR